MAGVAREQGEVVRARRAGDPGRREVEREDAVPVKVQERLQPGAQVLGPPRATLAPKARDPALDLGDRHGGEVELVRAFLEPRDQRLGAARPRRRRCRHDVRVHEPAS